MTKKTRATTPRIAPQPAPVPQPAVSNFALKSEAALDWFTKNAANLGEIAQIALAAGVHMSPQAQTAATIAVLLGHAHEQAPPAPQQ